MIHKISEMAIYCFNWIQGAPDINRTVNAITMTNPNYEDANFWKTVFIWTEIMFPSLPPHLHHRTIELVQEKVEQFGFRLNVVGRLIIQAFGEKEEGQLAIDFICMAEVLSRIFARDYKTWIEQGRNGEVGEFYGTTVLDKALVSLMGAKSAVTIALK